MKGFVLVKPWSSLDHLRVWGLGGLVGGGGVVGICENITIAMY